jgi:cellulose biosynthesis protein BcsQ
MAKHNPRIVSVLNRKGGVGKSTVTMLLAGALGAEGKRVLVLDCDEQQSIFDMCTADAGLYADSKMEPLFEVEACPPGDVIERLGGYRARYDVIFIDAPRVTESKTDTNLGRILAVCDAVLVPVLGSMMDVLSTSNFVYMLQGIAEFKQKNDLPFEYAGFINRGTVRKENRDAMDVLKNRGLPFMENAIPDLKIFSMPSAYTPILGARGGIRFLPFFSEFRQRFKI